MKLKELFSSISLISKPNLAILTSITTKICHFFRELVLAHTLKIV